MTRKNFIAGNWKMNNTIGEAVVLAQEISNHFYRDLDRQGQCRVPSVHQPGNPCARCSISTR